MQVELRAPRPGFSSISALASTWFVHPAARRRQDEVARLSAKIWESAAGTEGGLRKGHVVETDARAGPCRRLIPGKPPHGTARQMPRAARRQFWFIDEAYSSRRPRNERRLKAAPISVKGSHRLLGGQGGSSWITSRTRIIVDRGGGLTANEIACRFIDIIRASRHRFSKTSISPSYDA